MHPPQAPVLLEKRVTIMFLIHFKRRQLEPQRHYVRIHGNNTDSVIRSTHATSNHWGSRSVCRKTTAKRSPYLLTSKRSLQALEVNGKSLGKLHLGKLRVVLKVTGAICRLNTHCPFRLQTMCVTMHTGVVN